MKNDSHLTAVILAAGKSSRMGEFKPLLKIGGISAVERLTVSIGEAGIRNIIVVTGHNSSLLEEKLSSFIQCGRIKTAFNPDYEQGMFTSVQTGLRRALEISCGQTDAVLLFPVDIPLVPSQVIGELMAKNKEEPDRFIVPCFEGKKGHPLVIPGRHIDEILKHDGTNGLKGVISVYDDRLIRMETGKEEVVLDMDKPEDYAEIIRHFEASESRGNSSRGNIVASTGFDGRLFLVRHGSTRPHREKIYMGQVDIPLSGEGEREAKTAAEELVNVRPYTGVIYTSPLLRAKKTARIIQDEFADCGTEKHIVEIPGFMEMSLGDWDGRYISEIKREFPHEFDKRGKNILTYKRSPDGENYYDLRYRVLKELKSIMSECEPGEDIILVTHKGVINVIRANVYDLDLQDAVGYNPPKGSITVIE